MLIKTTRDLRGAIIAINCALAAAVLLSGCALLPSTIISPLIERTVAPARTATSTPVISVVVEATPTLALTTASKSTPTVVPPVKPPVVPPVKPTVVPTAKPTAAPTAPPVVTYSLNLYNGALVRYQNPDMTACTAASTLMMLNFTATKSPSLGSGFVWKTTTAYSSQEAILAYERAHMTMLLSSQGTDAHGWRNALNYYGWGSMTADVYEDHTYTSYAAAANAAVHALATTGKPVAILGWAGQHAQILNGYTVTGADPATHASGFTIKTLYITDPLASDGYRNVAISSATWKSGNSHIAFRPYKETDSPYADPIDGAVGKAEWYGKWVLVLPVR